MMKSCRLASVLRQVLGALSFAALLVFAYSAVANAAATATYPANSVCSTPNATGAPIDGTNGQGDEGPCASSTVSYWQSQEPDGTVASCGWQMASNNPVSAYDPLSYTNTVQGGPSSLPCGSWEQGNISFSCPNGGTLESAYPGYCIVNGQPPTTNACTASKGKFAGSYDAVSPNGSPVLTSADPNTGCEIQANQVLVCVPDVPSSGQQTCLYGGTYDGNVASNVAPTAVGGPSPTNPPDTSCVQGSVVVCGSSNASDTASGSAGCGYVDGNPFCASQVPNDSCISAVNSGVFCTVNTPSPPAPNNGTYGTPAAPTQTVLPGVSGNPSVTGTGINYMNPTVVAGSTTKPVTIGTGTNPGSTTTAPTGGSGCPAEECALLTQILSAATSTESSSAKIAGAATYIAAQFATTVSMPATNTTNAQAPLIAAIGSAPPSVSAPVTPDLSSLQSQLGGPCVPETWTIDGVSMPFNVCDAAIIIQGLMQMLLYGVLVIYLWKRFLATGLFKRTDT